MYEQNSLESFLKLETCICEHKFINFFSMGAAGARDHKFLGTVPYYIHPTAPIHFVLTINARTRRLKIKMQALIPTHTIL